MTDSRHECKIRSADAYIRMTLIIIPIFFSLSGFAQQPLAIPLAGEWKFTTDPSDKGIAEKWYLQSYPETIRLPGSMAENNKGDAITLQTKWTGSIYDSSWYFNPRMAKYRQPGNVKFPFWLTPAKHYVGAAWYRKEVIIPQNTGNRRWVLYLERAHTETMAWVDGKPAGMQNTMVAPQEFDATGMLAPGKHIITLRIDNRIKAINVGQDSHSLTDHTQGNWNGVVGNICLKAGATTWLDDVQVYPDVAHKTARVVCTVRDQSTQSSSGKLLLSAKSFNTKTLHEIKPVSVAYTCTNGAASVEVQLPMGDRMQTWDEFNPVLYLLTVGLTATDKRSDERKVQFGMREFTATGTRFYVNGHPVFLRGTVNNCEFPLTGYAAMDEAAWERIYRIAKAHGLNHMRFHSWCPPEAAFIAADKAGFYLQPEGPSWANHGTSIGDGKPIDQFIYDETNRMAKSYGNYASYCMLAYGNEPRGKQVEYLTGFVNYWRAKDHRRLYTGASVGGSWPVIAANEYMVRGGARGLDWVRRPESQSDYRKEIGQFKVPFVAHEMGQWCVFPDFNEIKKYTGVYRAKNFELFQEDLKDRGMGDQGEQFKMASGKLQALCYKNEIEKAMRTPGYAGFELLSLNDYPGQGTALVGVLNAFWDEKGYISAAAFHRFCNATVPLMRTTKFVYNNDETIHANIELFHFRPAPLQDAVISWKVTDGKSIIAKGIFNKQTFAIGNCLPAGTVDIPLADIYEAAQLNLEVSVNNTPFVNDWNFWVYPTVTPKPNLNGIYFCDSLDQQAADVLAGGGKVLLNAAGKVVKGKEVVQQFLPVFWNTSWFKMRPPHTLGIVCDPAHPAFKLFPTANHSDLQWWELLNRSQVMNLEDFPAGFRPLVQPIDTWFLNRRLGLILEAKVGKGKIIVSSADLYSDPANRPAARQLLYSLERYMQSDAFNPPYSVDLAVIKEIFKTPSRETVNLYTKDSPDELKPKVNN